MYTSDVTVVTSIKGLPLHPHVFFFADTLLLPPCFLRARASSRTPAMSLDDLKRVEMGDPALVHTVYVRSRRYKKLPNNGKVDIAKYAKALPREQGLPELIETPLWCRTGSVGAELHELFSQDICSSEALVTVETRKELCLVDGSDLHPLHGNGKVWAVKDVNNCCKILEQNPTLQTALWLLDRPRPRKHEQGSCWEVCFGFTMICFALLGLFIAFRYIIRLAVD